MAATISKRWGSSSSAETPKSPLGQSARLPLALGALMDKDQRSASRAQRFWAAANARGIPLQAIVATVAVAAAAYLAGKLIYRLRDVVLLLLVAGFIAVLLNPLVAALQHWGIRRRGR